MEFLEKEGYVAEIPKEISHLDVETNPSGILRENEYATVMMMKLGYPKLMDWITFKEAANDNSSKIGQGLSEIIDGLAEINKEKGFTKIGLRKHFGLLFLSTYEYVIT